MRTLKASQGGRRCSAALLAAIAPAALACASPATGAQPPDVQIVKLSIVKTESPVGEPIHVDAQVSKSLNVVVPAALVVTAGADVERFALHPGVCTIEGDTVACGEVIFAVGSGRRAQDYDRTVRALGGVLVARPGPAAAEWMGLVRVPFGEEVRVRNELRQVEGVIDAHLNFLMSQRYVGNRSVPEARSIIPTGPGAARPGDGVLQVTPGSSVQVASASDQSVSVLVIVSDTTP